MTTQIRPSRPIRFSAFKTIILCLLAGLSLPTMLYADWDGGVKKPSIIEKDGKTFYEIESAENLAWFATQINKGNTGYNAVLKRDIAIVDTAVGANSVKWTPIGDADSVSYKGVFDGDGHTISGVYSNAKYAGFFGFIGPGAVIKNLNLQNALVQSYFGVTSRAGLLSSMFSGDSVINVSVAGTVSDTTYAGGLAAIIKSKAYIDGFRGDVYFVGKAKKYNEYIVYSTKQVAGGVAALVLDSVRILNSRVSGSVDSTDVRGYVGGFIGIDSAYAYFENDTNDINMKLGSYPYILGGYVTRVTVRAAADFVGCLNRGNILGASNNVAGFVGKNEGNLSFSKSTNEGTVKMTASSLAYAGGFVGQSRLDKDSDTIEVSFEYCINKGYVYSPHSSGGFVGGAFYTKQSITASENAGKVSGKEYVGGFVGYVSSHLTYIDYSRNTGNIVGPKVGGFVGVTYGKVTIDHSINDGDISGLGSYTAGFISCINKNAPTVNVKNSANRGKITAGDESDVGGILGATGGSNAVATNCENYGEILVESTDSSSIANVGGIIGNYGTAKNCRNYGNITTSIASPHVGGIAGYGGHAERCINKGTITANAKGGQICAGGIGGTASTLLSLNEGRVVAHATSSTAAKCYVAGITVSVISSSRFKMGGNINKGTVAVDGGVGHVYPLFGTTTSARAMAGSISLSDSIVNNGRLTAGSTRRADKDTVAMCSFFDKDALLVEDDSLGFGVSAAEMQTEEFAWRLNTCNGKIKNNGYWSQRGENYPIHADLDNRAIRKITFRDSSKVINVKDYIVGESFTDYTGKIIHMPESPNPSDADEDLKFGYWAVGNDIIDENTVILNEFSVYAFYVSKKSPPEILVFNQDGDIRTSYAIYDKTTEISLPSALSKTGYEFIGWYNGDQFVGTTGTKIIPNGLSVLNAKYEPILYKISFMNGSEVLQMENLAYGKIPEYRGQKPSSGNADYVFDGWTPLVAAVSSDINYYAHFASIVVESSSSVASSSSQMPSSSSVIASSSSDESSSSKAETSSSAKSESSSSSKENSSSSAKQDASSSSKGTDVVWNAVRPTFNLAVNGMTLTLTNAQGGVVRIFDSLGHLVTARSLVKAATNITLQTPGSYIVRVNGISKSVTLK